MTLVVPERSLGGFDIMDVPNIQQGRSVSVFTSVPSSELWGRGGQTKRDTLFTH